VVVVFTLEEKEDEEGFPTYPWTEMTRCRHLWEL
jgi:hypothetical protein